MFGMPLGLARAPRALDAGEAGLWVSSSWRSGSSCGVAARHTVGGGKVSPWWLVGTYFIHTVGELCLVPVGLSSVTKLAPRRLVGQMMGTLFMGTALGNLIAGLAAGGFQGMSVGELFATVARWPLAPDSCS